MNRKLIRAIRWGTAAAVIAALFFYLDVRSVVEHVQNVRWWIAAPALLALTLLHIIAALTWRYFARSLGNTEISRAFAVRSFYISQALGSVTPGNLGGDAYRIHALNGQGKGWQLAAVPIVAQRLTSYVALAFLGVLATIFIPVSFQFRAMLLLIPAAALVFIGATWAFLRFRPGSGVLAALSREAPVGRAFWSAFCKGSGLALIFHGLAVIAGFVLLTSVTAAPEILAAFAAISLARVASVLPITPSGIGVQEAGLALLLPLAGVEAEAAVTFAALSRLAFVLTIVAGAVLFAMRRGADSTANADALPGGPSFRTRRKGMQGSRS